MIAQEVLIYEELHKKPTFWINSYKAYRNLEYLK